MGFGTTQEVLTICLPKKVLILSGGGLVSRLYGVLEKHLYRGQKNRGSETVAQTLVNTRHPSFLQICQLLLTIHPGI